MHARLLPVLLSLFAALAACAAPGKTPEEKRAWIDSETSDVLARLFERVPEAEKQIESAAGCAVFTNLSVDVLFVGGGGGYGVAVDSATGERTYMRMAEGGIGLGLGVKDFRAVFVFETPERFRTFVEKGWDAGASADAVASARGEGASYIAAASFVDGVAVYQLTDNGLALRVNLKGTKYFPYSALN